ncbi:MAG: ABC transporter permease [Bacteriovoracia bacterium]
MLKFTLGRLLASALTLAFLIPLTFFLLRFAPGGPFDGERAWPVEIQRNIEQKYGLHEPLWRQFTSWAYDVLRGDLHESFQYLGKPVREIIAETLPNSIHLGLWALLGAVVIGIGLGSLAAAYRGSWLDWSSSFLAMAGISLPSYLVASLLILCFSFWLDWLPPALMEDPGSLVLPAVTLGLRPMAIIARLTRASLLDTLASDYIRTAYAKGLSRSMVVFKHALRNSLIPVVTLLGPLTANLITGSFVVEIVFQIPGIGKYFVTAVLNRDYPLVMGVTLIYGMILIGSNFLVDLSYGWIDPRMRSER